MTVYRGAFWRLSLIWILEVPPLFAAPNAINRVLVDAEAGRECYACVFAYPNSTNIVNGEFGFIVRLASRVEAEMSGVRAVFASRHVFEVIRPVVLLVRVFVIHALSQWFRPQECQGDQAMPQELSLPIAARQDEHDVAGLGEPVLTETNRQMGLPSSAHIALVGDLVKRLIAFDRNRPPLLGTHDVGARRVGNVLPYFTRPDFVNGVGDDAKSPSQLQLRFVAGANRANVVIRQLCLGIMHSALASHASYFSNEPILQVGN